MTPDERQMLLDMAGQLLRAGHAEELVRDLADAEDLWDDSETVAALFDLHGELGATSRLLDLAILRQPDGRFLLPLPGSARPPARVLGSLVEVDGILLGRSNGADIVVGTDSDDVLVVSGLTETPVEGFDPSLGVVRVTGSRPVSDCREAIVDGGWDLLASRAARVLAYELLGLSRAALGVARDHVRSRHQFGRPLAAFQTVQHRLADACIAETGARELLDATDETAGLLVHVTVLKALAGRAALTTVRAAQQVCGAMGFTAEFGLHHYVRRAYLLDSLFGGCEEAEFDLARLAIDGGLPDRLVALAGATDA